MLPILARAGLLVPVAAYCVAGCSLGPRRDAGPVTPLTWLSYLQGDDLRQGCGALPGAGGSGGGLPGERYRLVYNSTGSAPVRVFDVAGSFAAGATVDARRINVDSLAAFQPGDPLAAWDGHIDRVRLSPQQFVQLAQRLAVGGAFGPPPSRLNLAAERLRWFVTGCHAGDFFVAAYAGVLEPGQPASLGGG